MGLIFVGIDVIDGNLTEINVTSPTGLRAIKRLGGPDLAAAIWDAIEARSRACALRRRRGFAVWPALGGTRLSGAPELPRRCAGPPRGGKPFAPHSPVVQGLEHDAIALGQLEELVDLLLRRVGVELEGEADRRKPTGAVLSTPSVPRKSRSPSALHGALAQRRSRARSPPPSGSRRRRRRAPRAACRRSTAPRPSRRSPDAGRRRRGRGRSRPCRRCAGRRACPAPSG